MTDEAKPRWFFANLAHVRLSQQVAGQMSVVEFAGPPGDMPPLHLHRTDDEAWYVLEGEMSFFIGDDEPTRIEAGAIGFGPKGVPHTYRVEGEQDARWLAVCTPGDFERFVLAASRPARAAGASSSRRTAERGRGCRDHHACGRTRDRTPRTAWRSPLGNPGATP